MPPTLGTQPVEMKTWRTAVSQAFHLAECPPCKIRKKPFLISVLSGHQRIQAYETALAKIVYPLWVGGLLQLLLKT